MPKPLPAHFQLHMDLLNDLYAAYGGVCHLGKRDPLYRLAWAALQECEELLCRADWRVYRNWARKFGEENNCAPMEPCDAWFESAPTSEPWLDETPDEMAKFAAEMYKDERKNPDA